VIQLITSKYYKLATLNQENKAPVLGSPSALGNSTELIYQISLISHSIKKFLSIPNKTLIESILAYPSGL